MKEKEYEPELGQACFGQPSQQYECPEYITALLRGIGDEIERVEWNKTQQHFSNPFDNTGAQWGNDTFEVRAYDWNEDNQQGWNFKYRDIKIGWYKYLGRGMSINRNVTEKEAVKMFDDCIRSAKKMDVDILRK